MFCFEGSGIFSGPYDIAREIDNPDNSDALSIANQLREHDARTVVPFIDMKSHVLFTKR